MIIAHIVNHWSKVPRFYLDSASEVHIYFNRLLFSIYNKKNSPPIRIANYAELVVLTKGMVTFDVLVDGKPEVINFCNVFYTPKLE